MSRYQAASNSAVPCILCGSKSSRPLVASQGYAILRCNGCSLAYLSPQPAERDQQELYGETYFNSEDGTQRGYSSYLAQAANLRATFRERLPYLVVSGPGNRLLDVGAAAGHFVKEAREAGWNAEGLEYSRWAAEYANRELGVPVREGTLENAGFPAGAFDVVTMWEVIEHLADPRNALREIRRILTPDGMLHLSTPDAGSLVARMAGKRWLGWRKIPEHLFFFDFRSLERLLASEGFQVTSHRYVPLTVTWDYALERLGAMIGLPVASLVPSGVRRRSVRINCFYDLMVSARVR
jgi:2-polyprenyl-3-methyl-5-hydroxy-6-metoxy-1,4-benzoquinol methylase